MISQEMIEALCTLSYGLYVVTSRDGENLNGQLANAVVQVTAEPPRLVVCIHRDNLTHEYISKSRVFAVSVLEEATPMTFIGLFGFKSGRDVDKLAQVEFETGKTGAPVVLENTLAVVEGKVIDEVSVGTHTLFVADVVRAEIVKDAPPLTYAYYRAVKGGKSPKNAPTYGPPAQAEKDERRKGKMKKYVCSVCGYVYDPEVGDPESSVPPGTAFEDLPDDWVCPVCGVGKDEFSAQE